MTDSSPGLRIGVLSYVILLNIVVAGVLGLLSGSLSDNAMIGLLVAVGWLLLLAAYAVAVSTRRKKSKSQSDESMFLPSPRLLRRGIKWRARVVHIQRRRVILFAIGHLSVSENEIQFMPRRGQSGPFMPVFSWETSLDQIQSVDVTTPSGLVSIPRPHLRITTTAGKQELFRCPGRDLLVVALSLNRVLDEMRAF